MGKPMVCSMILWMMMMLHRHCLARAMNLWICLANRPANCRVNCFFLANCFCLLSESLLANSLCLCFCLVCGGCQKQKQQILPKPRKPADGRLRRRLHRLLLIQHPCNQYPHGHIAYRWQEGNEERLQARVIKKRGKTRASSKQQPTSTQQPIVILLLHSAYSVLFLS
jgi:hypothetical protein